MKKLLLLFTFAFFLFTFSFSQQYGWTDISANMPEYGRIIMMFISLAKKFGFLEGMIKFIILARRR